MCRVRAQDRTQVERSTRMGKAVRGLHVTELRYLTGRAQSGCRRNRAQELRHAQNLDAMILRNPNMMYLERGIRHVQNLNKKMQNLNKKMQQQINKVIQLEGGVAQISQG